MPHSLSQTQACSDIADLLGSFLPGSGSPQWKGHVSFATVAHGLGIGEFWQGGSKLRSLATLLDLTLKHRRGSFEPLILAVVSEGLLYRRKGGSPITREEIVRLNGLLRRVGFQFPSLLDANFLDSLPVGKTDLTDTSPTRLGQEQASPKLVVNPVHLRLEALRGRFYNLHQLENRQQAGLDLERLLNEMFHLFGMAPRAPFRLIGEQIDGSFDLDNETYLIEAKWEHQRTQMPQLLVFHEKIQSKSGFTRGVFFTMSSLTDGAQDGFTRGRQPRLFVVDGYDLTTVFEGQIPLDELLRKKQRRLAEEGLIFVSVRDLFDQNRG